MCKKANRYGFTLIELLVVISIIAVLLAVLMPSLQKAREQGKRTVCLNNVKSMVMAIGLYGASNNDRMPTNLSWHILSYQGITEPYPTDPQKQGAYGLILPILNNWKVFCCPTANNKIKIGYNGKWGVKEGYTEYCYLGAAKGKFGTFGNRTRQLPRKLNVADRLAKANSSTLLISDLTYAENWANHGYKKKRYDVAGNNEGFADGHVEWLGIGSLVDAWYLGTNNTSVEYLW